ncbi:PAS domain-containing sensor histidine kinase [Hymenobacter gummosus]|uniref:histidine kinase n=1 Tax=Hymenobacter gummosus TaxID=1776032 RepID=A0A431U6I7_9BACT|nr:PAS domain-containing sensor histidine kinase [Hymenobacter gummosus]RTQ52123.1 PAS domain-containing sensor histidine kinase [Hymenobacter gummosus]
MQASDLTPGGAPPAPQLPAWASLNDRGELVHGNAALAALLGCPVGALAGQSLVALLEPADAPTVRGLLPRAGRGEALSCPVRLPAAAGWYELTLLPAAGSTEVLLRPLSPAPAAPAPPPAPDQEREAQLNIIFESISDVIFVLGVEGPRRYRFQFVNAAFLRITGLPREQVLGRAVAEVIPEPSLSLALGQYQAAIRSGQTTHWVETSDYPSGRLVGEVCVTPVFDAAGTCQQLVGVVHDVTEQQQAEQALRESNERFRYALKATTDALYDWDVAADTLFWGEGFAELFGYQLAQNPTPFSQWSAYVHPDDAARTVDDLRYTAFHTEQPRWQQEYRFQRADGSWATVFDRGYLLRDARGRAVRMIGAMQDVSERKAAEQRQQQLAQELFQQNADLQQFTYLLSHNLRAPLANATGFAGLLGRLQPGTAQFEQTLEYLNTSLRRVDEILHDLNAILSVRGQALLVVPEPVPLAEVLGEVTELLAAELAGCGAEVCAELPPALRLQGRKAYFHSIFYNLLTNAIKYRAPERPLRVVVGATTGADGSVALTVADNGTGFDAGRRDAFQLYQRFHTGVPGRGIGLFLVKAHAESMGGRVAVSSRVGQGTTFTLQFSSPAA